MWLCFDSKLMAECILPCCKFEELYRLRFVSRQFSSKIIQYMAQTFYFDAISASASVFTILKRARVSGFFGSAYTPLPPLVTHLVSGNHFDSEIDHLPSKLTNLFLGYQL